MSPASAGGFFTGWATREAQLSIVVSPKKLDNMEEWEGSLLEERVLFFFFTLYTAIFNHLKNKYK